MTNTVGIVLVACCIAFCWATPLQPPRHLSSTLQALAAGLEIVAFSAGNRFSSTIFLLSIYPKSFSPVRSAAEINGPSSALPACHDIPIFGILFGCCPRHQRPRHCAAKGCDERAPVHCDNSGEKAGRPADFSPSSVNNAELGRQDCTKRQ
jgi:hypothetical protein